MKKLLIFLLLSFISILPNLNAQEADFIYLADGFGNKELIKYDNFGNLIWTFSNSDFIYSVTNDLNNNVYVGTTDFNSGPEKITALDPNKNLLWTYTLPSGEYARIMDYDVNNDFLYVATSQGNVYKLNPLGSLIWSNNYIGSAFEDINISNDGNIYVVGNDTSNNTYPVIKINESGIEQWRNTDHTDIPYGVVYDNNNNVVYSSSTDNTVKKISDSGNTIWTFSNHTNIVNDVTVDKDGFVYSVSNDQTLRKIDPLGNEIYSYLWSGQQILEVEVDGDGFIYIMESGGFRKLDSNRNIIWSKSGVSNTDIDITPASPEPPTYTVKLTSNYKPYTPFIYIDDEQNGIFNEIDTTILNDESFTVTSSVIDITPFQFNFWFDLDNNVVFSNDRNFNIEDPSRNYNLVANYSLNNAVTFNIDSTLPSPPAFELIIDNVENTTSSIIKYPFDEEPIPFSYNYQLKAPTENIGFYNFDYWYDNDNNEIYSNDSLISQSAINDLNLTATYSLPNEYQINLTLESDVGDIIFQHGTLDPITGSFISVTIGEGDTWSATAPSNPNFQFDIWLDLDNMQSFSNNPEIGISNTTQNYNLRAFYDVLRTIHWDSNGGTLIPNQKVVNGSLVNPPNEPIRPGFVFDGWENSLGQTQTFPTTITEDITFTAIWLETYNLTYDTNGGGRIDADTYIENAIPQAVTPSRFGYEFTGWFTDDGTFQNAYEFTDPITQDTTIHARWAFGSDRDAQLSLTTFLDDNDLGDGFSQIVIMITIYIFVNIIILIYQAPLIVTLILNFIVTSLFMILGWIAIWLVVVIFMSLFGLLYFFSSGRGITE